MRRYYRPEKRTGKYAVICFIPLALAVGAVILGLELKKSVFYALAVALFFFSVQIFTVYILPVYEYGLDGGILSIYRVIGGRRRCVYDLDLNYAKALISCKEVKKYIKENGKPRRRFYCVCGNPKNKRSVLFYETDASLALYFAPDESFFEAVRAYIR